MTAALWCLGGALFLLVFGCALKRSGDIDRLEDKK